MKAEQLVLVSPGVFEVGTADVPSPGPGQLLIEVMAGGVCKSDVDGYRGNADVPANYVAGHEGLGRVVEIGEGVTAAAVGDVVATLGDGRFSSYSLAGEHEVAKITAPVIDPTDWIVEPLACCLNAVEQAAVKPADLVAVVGAGYMGQGVIRALGLTWAAHVMAMDVKPEALKRATDSGADSVVSLAEEDAVARAAELAGVKPSTAYVLPGQPQGPLDVVFECSGTPAGLALANSLLRVGGTLVMVGFQRSGAELDGPLWHMRGIKVLNASPMSAPDFRDTFRRTAALMSAGKLSGAGLVTHSAGLADAKDVFEAAGGPSYLKGAITL